MRTTEYGLRFGLLVLAACAPVGPAPAVRQAPVRIEGVVADRGDLFAKLDTADWPAPSRLRTAFGEPGPDYWQQRADYHIDATLDTAARRITARVRIDYTNASPDTLRALWLQLDQNLYRADSRGAQAFPKQARFGVNSFDGGYALAEVRLNGVAVTPHVDDTLMRLDLTAPLAPIVPRNGRATIEIAYAFRVPEYGSDRMGRDGALYQVAQWYPRMAVYDDVRGWNTDPYLGQGEFYLEYGDIDYALTVPAGYIVAASGTLQNATEILPPAMRARLDVARTSDSVVAVIGPSPGRPRPVPGAKTWRFRAERVRDVAWAAAPDFRWDAIACGPALCQAFYDARAAAAGWGQAAEITRWSINMYSALLAPYPYPTATTVAGPVEGMEYPSLVFVGREFKDAAELFGTIDHEQGHEWFPMLVGSNERRYAWQDEGLNTFVNYFSAERRFPGTSDWAAGLQESESVRGTPLDAPLMTMPDRIAPDGLGALAYSRPAVMLVALRDHVVGRERFDSALREYTRRWSFRHPTPSDFFRTIEQAAGADLSWFWRAYFYGSEPLDIGISGVVMQDARVSVTLDRLSSAPFPVQLRLRYADGTTEDVSLPVTIWRAGRRYEALLPVRGRVVGARLWPVRGVPDANDANDVWGDAPIGDVGPAVTGDGLAPPIARAIARPVRSSPRK